MTTERNAKPVSLEPTDDDVRDYAYHLYLQSGRVAGRDLENWLEAKACLSACVPDAKKPARLRPPERSRAQSVDTPTSLEVRSHTE